MELNKVYNTDFLNNKLQDKCADLIIADPPYYKVKGEFDFVWDSFDEYLQDVEKWAVECKRILKDNGTLFWWGGKKNIAYSQVVLDKYFNLENSLIWQKIDSMQYQYYSVDLARTFNTHNERLLMYSNEIDSTGLEAIMDKHIKPKNPFGLYLKKEFKKAGVSNREIAELFPSKTGGITGCVSNWLNGDNVITEKQYLRIREYLNNEYLRKEYEDLRKEYEGERRYFKNTLKLEEVLKFSQQSSVTKYYDHDTVKPEKLTRALITTCSRQNAFIVVPFAGSGTECAMAVKEGRSFVGYEINEKYSEMANERVDRVKSAPEIFSTAWGGYSAN